MSETKAPTEGPFEILHHLCLVVRDLEATLAYFESIGLGPWHDYPPLDEYVDLAVPNEADFKRLEFKWTQAGPIQLQVVAPPPGDTEHRRFLETRGEGVFHLGFVVDDIDAGEEAALARGLAPLMRGRRANGSGFTYFRTADAGAGVTLALRQSPPVV